MISAFAAAAAIASQSPAKILSGNYHPTADNDNLLQAITGNGGGQRALPINADALSVALDVVQIWAVMLTISFTLIIFFFLAFCVCTKRENSYGDFENTQGITTVKVCRNGGENGIHIGPPLGSSTLGSPRATDETSEASSRYTHQRELPAIPTNASRSNRESMPTRPTANEAGHGVTNVKLIGGVQVIPTAAMKSGGRVAVIKESVVVSGDARSGASKTATASAALPGHSYVVVSHSKKEHAYAKVVHGNAQEPETDTDNYDDPAVLVKDTRGIKSDNLQKASNQQTSQSTIQNRSSIICSEPAAEQKAAAPEPSVVIPAAMAISGRTRANEELPYMTPAALQQQQQPVAQQSQPQQNYSGDSHDSRGYTSISVREPLAALKARQQQEGSGAHTAVPRPATKRQEPESEGYYMTVSDDSADETYACIDENSRHGSNATYARINLPATAASTRAATAAAQLSPTGQETAPPAPPSVDSLKHVVHSRQASAGSAASTGLSSPNTERRATKSPLPPLPQGDPDLYSADVCAESTQKATSDASRVTDTRNLEEMYAKVNKKRSGHSRGNSSGGVDNDCASNTSSRRSSADIGRQALSPTAAKSSTAMTTSLIDTHSETSRNMPSDISLSWCGGAVSSTQPPSKSYSRDTTDTKSYSRETSDPGYETVKSSDPPYASVDPCDSYPSYEVVRPRDTSDMESEHGYETLRHKETEPGYETVQDVPGPTVPSVRYTSRDPIAVCSDYETVSSTDAGYESVPAAKSGYDPGYEELSGVHNRTVSECDPNYEQLKFKSTASDCGYEPVSKRAEGNYELVGDYDTPAKLPDHPVASMPLYATVNKKVKSSPVVEDISAIASGLPESTLSEEGLPESATSREDIADDEEQHVSVVRVADHSVPPMITEMIPKAGLHFAPPPPTVYPVTESPEDVELPPPELAVLEAVASAAALDCGLDRPSPPMSRDTASLLASFADLAATTPIKALDVDLITGLYTNAVADDCPIPTTAEGHVIGTGEPISCCNDLIGDLGPQIDLLLAESLPPPPMIDTAADDLCAPVMPLPPPVDDICGNQDLFGAAITHSDLPLPMPMNGDIPPPADDFPCRLMEVLPPPQLDAIEASLAATNSVITVTVNPMDRMRDGATAGAPTASSLIRAALSSESSGSTANGGSVESVVTVDVVKKNGAVEVSSPPSTASAASSSDTKDGGQEALTPV